MEFEPTALAEVILIRPKVFGDSRGYFLETWQERKLPDEMSLFWLRGVSAAPGDRALVVGSNGLAVTVDKDKVRLAANL